MVLFSNSFGIIFIIVFLASSFRAPVTCLVDSLVISSLPNKEDYGKMRLFGAISFGLFSFISGLVVEDFKLIVFIHSLLMFGTGFIILSIERKYEAKTMNDQSDVSIWDSIVEVFKRKIVQSFIVIVFLSGFGSGVIDSFLFIRLRELGGSGLVMGISRSITCAAEVHHRHYHHYHHYNTTTIIIIIITRCPCLRWEDTWKKGLELLLY